MKLYIILIMEWYKFYGHIFLSILTGPNFCSVLCVYVWLFLIKCFWLKHSDFWLNFSQLEMY